MADQMKTFGQDISDRASDVAESARDISRSAVEKVDEARGGTAARIATAASALRRRAEDLPGGDRVVNFAHSAADGLSTTADYIRSHDAKRMMADVEVVVKKHPGPALLVAGAFGFLLGRALARE